MQIERITAPVDVLLPRCPAAASVESSLTKGMGVQEASKQTHSATNSKPPGKKQVCHRQLRECQHPLRALQRQTAHTAPCLPSRGRHPSNKEPTLGRAKEFIPLMQARPLPPCLFLAVSLQACQPHRAGTMYPRMFGQQLCLISFGLLHPLEQKQQTETVPASHRFSLLLLQEMPWHWGQEALAGTYQCQ